ncbi:hypothetical protein C7212DRAFT_332190 [Tuber magnatum]|uniref:Uncharacterized protein n=1 Tax=Tuber magnatum TaxID=42249 RepID=A0A317SJC0_9PEZI|nr:hypothetical protein C7212DRAFT_332190 [Tuber magnatum]
MMGPLAGTIVCDFYLIRKRKLDIRELYKEHGIYWYTYGVNWRAFASFLLGFLPTLPGFAHSIEKKLDVGGAWKIYTFAWLFGFSVAVLSYYTICTYISPPTESLVEFAVLPPGKVDASLGTTLEEVASDYKVEDIAIGEKEVARDSGDSPV